jgi:hypothetical protein
MIHYISSVTDARYGVNILEELPPSGVRGTGTNIVAAIADLPWGPVNEPTSVSSTGELFSTFAPEAFGVLNDYQALKAFINKTFPNLVQVIRIAATGQATAAFTFTYAGPTDALVATARHPGAIGNQIAVQILANVDTPANRDVIVTIGTAYTSPRYENVVVDNGGSITVNDPGDPFVAFTEAAGPPVSPPDVIAATLLTGGADGTAVAGDYLGSGGTSGLDLLSDASLAWSVAFVAECPSGLVDAVNAGIKAFQDTHARGFIPLCTVPAQTSATALTYASSYRSDRSSYHWPLVKVVNTFDPDRGVILVDGNSFAAVAVASVAPELSPGGAPGAPFLRGILGLETAASLITLNALNAAGVAPWFMSTPLEGAIIHKGITTSLVPGLEQIFRRRMTDFILSSMANFLEQYVGNLLDLDLASSTLGPVTAPEIGALNQFLDDLRQNNRIRDYSIDPFSGNVQANIDAGTWIILLAVKLLSVQDVIILKASIGESVEIIPQT